MKQFLAIIVFIAFAFGARFVSVRRFHGGEIQPRVPAAIPKTFDYSHLEGQALESAVQRRLLTGTEFKKGDNGVFLHMGHFVTNDSQGHAAYACEVYNRVTFTFEAEGISVAGERPTLTVEGPCEMAENATEIHPLFIPIETVLSEKPGNLELTFNEAGEISLKFANMSEEWPSQWVLSGIKIFNRDDGRKIIVDTKSIRRLAADPLVMTW